MSTTDLFGDPATPSERAAGPAENGADSPLALPRPLPAQLHLGTSSWSFPGWAGLVYDREYTASQLARSGLSRYARHPLLRGVGIDRSFYAPLTQEQYARYAQQVADDFRFVIKAPSLVADATLRGEDGRGDLANPSFLDAALAVTQFVEPCVAGLGAKAGALVFQLSPLPYGLLADIPALIERLRRFLKALPALPTGCCYAVELRNPEMLTPRFIHMLNDCGVRYCIGIHARMPDVARQLRAAALQPDGAMVVRWSLHAGMKYEQARSNYAPFNQLVDEDPRTRQVLAEAAIATIARAHPVYVMVNNKAEGCAPQSLYKLGMAILTLLEASRNPP